jgi:hypothetical protein
MEAWLHPALSYFWVREEPDMENDRTVLIFGAAVMACVVAGGAADAQAPAPAANPAPAQTPRDANGHPVITGLWTGAARGVTGDGTNNVVTTYAGRGGSFVGLEADGGLRRLTNDNVPIYKPEYWDQITENDYQGNWEDPVDSCIPLGVPRSGVPAQILKVEGQPAYIWDGDSLVIESIGFTDASWLHKNGWMHGFDMKVTEKLTRIGDNLIWEATVEDPDYLQQPWKMTPAIAQVNKDPNGLLGEDPPCQVREPFSSHVRSG